MKTSHYIKNSSFKFHYWKDGFALKYKTYNFVYNSHWNLCFIEKFVKGRHKWTINFLRGKRK